MALEVFDDVEQGSDAWLQLRAGVPTASVFADILAKPKEAGKGMRVNLLHKLAGERITGEPAESYNNGFMDRGKRLEPEARRLYAMLSDDEVRTIGFMKDGLRGASPDALIGADGGLEIKTVTAAIMIATLKRDTPPPEHNAQVQGNLWISGRAWWDLLIYSGPKLPPRTFRIERDDAFIAKLAEEIDRFNFEVEQTVKWVSAYGQPQELAA